MEQSNYNPMLNTVILRNIFEVLPLSDLASCRQVCKSWFEESLTRWRRDMWLKLYDDDNVDVGSNATLTGLTLENFLLELNDGNACIRDPPNIEMKTFKKFKLYGWIFNSENDELKAQFWRTCGPAMTGLQIEGSEFCSLRDFKSVFWQALPNLVNLTLNNNYYEVDPEQFETVPAINDVLSNARNSNVRNLQVILSNSDFDLDPKFPLSFLEFLANYRNLKSVNLRGLCEYNGGLLLTFEAFLSAMVTLSMNGGYRWAVENLDILSEHKEKITYGSETIRLLQQLRFPLSSLILDIGSCTVPSDFKRILEIYANTLRKLVIFREDGHSYGPAVSHGDFPFEVQLNSLTELRLLGTAVTPNLNFFQYAPNLRSVFLVHDAGTSMLNIGSYLSDHDLFTTLRNRQNESIWGAKSPVPYPVGNTDFSKLENTVLPKMEEFILCGKHDTVCFPEQVAALARLMPNLRKVRLGLDNDGFRILCSAWKDLELLIIQPCEVNNCGITGTIPGLQTRLPNLTNLTRLSYLAFGCDDVRKSKDPIISYDFSRGVSTSTYVIEDAVPYRAQITDEVLQEFTQNMPHCKITRFNTGDEEWPEKQYERSSEDNSSSSNYGISDSEEDQLREANDDSDNVEPEGVVENDEMVSDSISDADEPHRVQADNRDG
ncbi:unnamed protein product [Orchesella dallaii]|uniref:F-box domain-containing protein n=1 Tax=Orchesella dallaii TaxID=48710 RepID=A0ABP1PUB6_9HEXA